MSSLYPPGYLGAVAQPLILSNILSLPLFGIGVAQTAYYYQSFPGDPRLIKAVVAILFCLDMSHTVCMVKSIKDWFLVDLLAVDIPKAFLVGTVLAYLTIFIVQCAYGVRLWLLTGANKFLVYAVLLLAMGQLGGGLGQAFSTFTGDTASVVHTSRIFDIAGKVELSCSLACDILITSSMVYLLRNTGGNSPIRRTSEVVNKIIIYSISVGLFTSVGTVLNMALWLGQPTTFNFVILHLILSKLYWNSLLVMLNSRVKLRVQLYSDNPVELSKNTSGGTRNRRTGH